VLARQNETPAAQLGGPSEDEIYDAAVRVKMPRISAILVAALP
jgi:hypothetical protein